jgi:hypothetical protein
MAKSTEERLDEAVVRAIELAREACGGRLVSMSMDFQPSGEYPYRMVTTDETLPLSGLARAESLPVDNT